jgi:hypothetical protein
MRPAIVARQNAVPVELLTGWLSGEHRRHRHNRRVTSSSYLVLFDVYQSVALVRSQGTVSGGLLEKEDDNGARVLHSPT